MGAENSLITPEIVDKITSSTDTLKALLFADNEGYESAGCNKGLAINLVLCDVVIENVFAGCWKPRKDLKNYNRITIYFRPLCKLSEEFSSNTDSILELQNREKNIKCELGRCNEHMVKMNNQLEQQLKHKAILEARIHDNLKTMRLVPERTINKRFIGYCKNELHNMIQELSRIRVAIAETRRCLEEAHHSKHNLQTQTNQSFNEMLDMLSEKYQIEKVESE